MNEKQRIKLSKLMSFILRHEPYKFNIMPDKEGFVKMDELVDAIRNVYSWVREEHIKEVVSRDEKGRYEIKGDKIRALYGHSYKITIEYEEDLESKILYHGTTKQNLDKILKEGIKPMRRQYVHLSINKEDAYITGKRHGKEVVIFVIDANCLRKRGYKIFIAGKMVRLTEYVPPDCIKSWEFI